MMLTPPTKISCPECGWSKILAAQPDVRHKPPIEICPKCGHTELQTTVIKGQIAQTLANLFGEK